GFGATVRDPDGNVYIDVSAGVGVTSVGRCHPAVVEAIHAQSQRLMHASDITNSKRIDLAAKIAAIMPDGLRANCVTYFTQSGSGAVEAAVKFAKRVTGRQQILAFHGAYHGVWNASNALTTGNQYRSGYGPFMGGVIHAPYPYGYRFPFDTSSKSAEQTAGEYVDYLLNTRYTGADDVAAVIVEPVQGEGGYIAPEPEFLRLVRNACDRAGALLIADEVQAGAGRTGKMWSIEHSGVKPDLLTFGKGMGGDLPMAGVAMRADLAKHIPPGSQPGTFAANALAAAVCLTNIELLTDPKLALIERAHRLGLDTLERLRAADCPLIGEVRGRGLMIGMELVADLASKTPLAPETVGRVVVESLNRGIVMVPCGRNGNVLRLMPALTIPRGYLFGALDRVLAVLAEV
ncbi:MAG TPA: aspartate aminotransferase family protein, partial [Steroidobacteraceae bacterium]|nr:aspartate aminotransferase family protein [Steroidobacteraceae bacterium]